MTEKVVSIDITAPAGEIFRYFAEHPIHHLPVVDRNRVVGMLSSADLWRLEALLPKAGDPIDYLNHRVRIDQIMRHPPTTIGPHAAVEQAASLMEKYGIHALPVTDPDGQLLGIITTTDVIHAAIHSTRCDAPRAGDVKADRPEVRVSPAQMKRALALAIERANAHDERGELGRALLYADSRHRLLDTVLNCAERYVRAGQDERLHAVLLRSIEKAREPEGASASAMPL